MSRHGLEGKPVIVRTARAGVHFGYLEYLDGMEVKLNKTMRIWSWVGAQTCSGLAMLGLDVEKSNLEAADSITLTEAIEVIPCSPAAVILLEAGRWTRK